MLYANTDDGSSAQWVCDGNGIVVDNISIYGAERAPILEQINEHYGTSFTGWSDNEIGLRFGDSLPNWNAYEKIYAPVPEIVLIKMPAGQQFILARYSEKTLGIACGIGTDTLIVVDNQGVVVTVQGPPFDTMKVQFEGYVEHAGYDVETTSIWEVSINVGDTMENWDSYITG